MDTQEFKEWTLLKNSAESSVSAYAQLCSQGWRIEEKVHEDSYMVYYVLSRTVETKPQQLTSEEADMMIKELEQQKAQGGTVFMQTFEVVDTDKAPEPIYDWAKRIIGKEKELQFPDGRLRLRWNDSFQLLLSFRLGGRSFDWKMQEDNHPLLDLAIIRALLTYFEAHKNEALPF